MKGSRRALAAKLLGQGQPPTSEPPIEPIFVRMLWGRVGSTLAMQLLATDPEIAFVRIPPFEERRAVGLLWHARAFAAEQPQPPAEWMDDPQQLWWIDPAAFHSHTSGDPLHHGPQGPLRAQLHRDAVAGLWAAFGAATRAETAGARFYAEKYGGFGEDLAAAGVPVRFVDLVRDPRDIWASTRAFDAKRGFYGFGRREGQSEDDYLRSLAGALRRRLEAMEAQTPGCTRLVVRYEDLVGDLPGAAGRLGRWLGARLDAAAVQSGRDRFRDHMTSPTADASVGRWRTDVPAAELAVFRDVLGDHLPRFGYEPG